MFSCSPIFPEFGLRWKQAGCNYRTPATREAHLKRGLRKIQFGSRGKSMKKTVGTGFHPQLAGGTAKTGTLERSRKKSSDCHPEQSEGSAFPQD
jgi:hypothetical protein